jgi:hypothetical protein
MIAAIALLAGWIGFAALICAAESSAALFGELTIVLLLV